MLVGGVLQGRLLTHRPQAELGNGQLRLGPPELGHERLTTHLASEGMLAQRAQLKPSIGLDPLDQRPAYAAAAPDPVGPSTAYAVTHLNADHADALLDMARVLAGFPDATAAVCSRADRFGLDLVMQTPRGTAYGRVGFATPCTEPDGLRAATVELTRRARA